MDFLGFIIGLLVVFFPPPALREQVDQAGEDMAAWARNRLPWHAKRIKSFFVRPLLVFALAQAVAFGFWMYALLQMEPELHQHPVVLLAGLYAGPGQLLFALSNYLTGRLRFNALPATNPHDRAEATRTMAYAEAVREAAELADQRFETVVGTRDPLAAPEPELVLAAMAASETHVRFAEAYAQAARAQAQVHRTSSAFACAGYAGKILQRQARLVAIVPGQAFLDAHFTQISAFANQAEQAAERAMVAEDQRVWVMGPGTRFSLPHWWAASLLISLIALAVSLDIYAVQVGDRWLFAMAFVPFAMAFANVRVTLEAVVWVWDKVVKLFEFVTTKLAQLAVAVLPGDTLSSARQTIKIEIFNEEKQVAAIREWINMAAIMWLPYKLIVFWVTLPGVAVIVASATVIATIMTFAHISRGKKPEVDESTTSTVRFFWKYGKWITVVVFLVTGASVEWDGLMNRLSGISPLISIPGDYYWYLLIAAVSLALMWAMWKFAAAAKGWFEKILKPAVAFVGVIFVFCALAPIAKAAAERETFKLDERTGPEAEKPVQMTPATVTYRPMLNGRQEMIITFYTMARQAKGVVRFDPQLASQLGVEPEVKVKTYGDYADCGGKRCRKHEVRIPELTSQPHGSFVVVMRRYLSVEVGERTFI